MYSSVSRSTGTASGGVAAATLSAFCDAMIRQLAMERHVLLKSSLREVEDDDEEEEEVRAVLLVVDCGGGSREGGAALLMALCGCVCRWQNLRV